VRAPSPRRLWKYVTRCLRLQSYFDSPGDGRITPLIPARALLWALLLSRLLREALKTVSGTLFIEGRGWRRAKLCGLDVPRLSHTHSFALRQPRSKTNRLSS